MENKNMMNDIKLRYMHAGELLKKFGDDDRNFYSLLDKVNEQLAAEGFERLSEDGFVYVIESIGWAI